MAVSEIEESGCMYVWMDGCVFISAYRNRPVSVVSVRSHVTSNRNETCGEHESERWGGKNTRTRLAGG